MEYVTTYELLITRKRMVNSREWFTVKKFLKEQKEQSGTIKAKLARFLLSYVNTLHPKTSHSPGFLLIGRPQR